jgi:hypothetical protein
MASLVLNGNTSGSITISSPSVSGSNTLTLPANTGTVLTTGSTFAGTGPAFSAYRNSTQSITSSAFTKIQCNTEEFDTNSNYDNATNYRFTPTVAGYYQINGEVSGAGTTFTRLIVMIYKNGALYKLGYDTEGVVNKGNVSSIVYCNGSTDYVELYAFMVGTSLVIPGTALDTAGTFFNGAMVRSA